MPRIHALFMDEPVFHPAMLFDLALHYPEQIVGVTLVSHKGKKHNLTDYLRKEIGFWGMRGASWIMAKHTLHKLLDMIPIPRAIVGHHSIRSVCREFGIQLFETKDVNSPDHIALLRSLRPDVILSSQGQILKKDLLNTPRLGCINRHSALLPKYGGLRPVFWALLNQEDSVGVTVHMMTEKIDRGRILAQRSVKVYPHDSVYSLYTKIFRVSVPTIIEAIGRLEHPENQSHSDSNGKVVYYKSPLPPDIHRFKEKGLRLL